MTNLYQSDVKSLSDEELRVLSEELSDEYQYAYGDDSESAWTDDAAEARHWEMQQELRRRWETAHPEYKHTPTNVLLRMLVTESLQAMAKANDFARAMSRDIDSEFASKVGDRVSVRMPVRFSE